MIRRYCDCCKHEMVTVLGMREGINGLGRLSAKIERNGVSLGVEVIQSTNGASNSGDVCKYCILDALSTLDDRPPPYQHRSDLYSQLADVLGCDPMDSHAGRLSRAAKARELLVA